MATLKLDNENNWITIRIFSEQTTLLKNKELQKVLFEWHTLRLGLAAEDNLKRFLTIYDKCAFVNFATIIQTFKPLLKHHTDNCDLTNAVQDNLFYRIQAPFYKLHKKEALERDMEEL